MNFKRGDVSIKVIYYQEHLLLVVVLLWLILSTDVHAQTVKYRWPMGSATTIQNYFDQSTSTSYSRYDCTATGGYDTHTGTDTGAGSGTAIYAAASGELYYRYNLCTRDGPKNSEPGCGTGYGNQVRIKHLDSKVTIYTHMKLDSPAWEQSLSCGKKIGAVGSSGRSTYNHLHFELWDNANIGKRIDPFSGKCSQPTSYWVNQNNGAPKRVCQ